MDNIIPERKLEFLWDYDFKGKSEQQVVKDLKIEDSFQPYVREAMTFLISINKTKGFHLLEQIDELIEPEIEFSEEDIEKYRRLSQDEIDA